MAGEEPTDVLPILNNDVLPILNNDDRGFDPAIRGYDRAQVDAFVARLDADLRIAQTERDAMAARSADIAAQLANTHAQVESLRRQLRSATEQVTPDNVDDHVAALLKAAQGDAKRLRAAAEEEAERIRNGAADAALRTTTAATAEAERIVDEATERHVAADVLFRDRMAEIEAHKATVEADLAASLLAVREEEERLTAQATADRDRLDAESAATRARLDAEAAATREALEAESKARRERADEDFELTLRARRTEQYALLHEQRAVAEAEAARMIADAQAEVAALHEVRDASHTRLDALADDLKAALAKAKA